MSAKTVSLGQTAKVLALATLSVLLVDFVFSGVKTTLGTSTNAYSNLAYLTVLYFCVGAFTAGHVYRSDQTIPTLLGMLATCFAALLLLRLVLTNLMLQEQIAGMELDEVLILLFRNVAFAALPIGTAIGIFVFAFRATEPTLSRAHTFDPIKNLDAKGKHVSTSATCSICGHSTETVVTGFFGKSTQRWCRHCRAFIAGNALQVLVSGVVISVFCVFAAIDIAGVLGRRSVGTSYSLTLLFLLAGFGHGMRLVIDGIRAYAKNRAVPDQA